MRLIGYSRVSTTQQADEGVSLEEQDARLRAYCAALNHELVDVIVDAGLSAKTLKRAGLKRALKMLRAREADGLLIVKLDRLTRNVRDLLELVERYFAPGKSALISLGESIDTATAAGRMLLAVLGVLAQWQREYIAERTREALRHKRARGDQLGPAPLGFRREGARFVEDLQEQLVLKRAKQLAAGGATLTAIARALKDEGHRTKRGGDWHLTTVRKMLARAGVTVGANASRAA